MREAPAPVDPRPAHPAFDPAVAPTGCAPARFGGYRYPGHLGTRAAGHVLAHAVQALRSDRPAIRAVLLVLPERRGRRGWPAGWRPSPAVVGRQDRRLEPAEADIRLVSIEEP